VAQAAAVVGEDQIAEPGHAPDGRFADGERQEPVLVAGGSAPIVHDDVSVGPPARRLPLPGGEFVGQPIRHGRERPALDGRTDRATPVWAAYVAETLGTHERVHVLADCR